MLAISPLLFFEGQLTTTGTIRHHLRSIVSVAGLLVILTTGLVGLGLHLALGLSLSLGLILAVISAPTDATALDAVSAGVQLPDSETDLLKLEGLFNDATGLVLLQVTIVFFQQHQLSLSAALLNFGRSAGGGILVGLLTGLAVMLIRQLLMRIQLKVSLAITLIYMLSPFLIFILAEDLGCSGILAVVTAGIVGNGENQRIRFINPRQSRWGMDLVALSSEFLNGIAFISLGLLIMRISHNQVLTWGKVGWWLCLGSLLYLGSLLVRYAYIRLTTKRSNRAAWLFALGGVHGAVNFALALSLAADHLPNQTFELIVMVEAIFILLSMLLPPLIFHYLLPAKPSTANIQAEQLKLKQAMVAHATMLVTQHDLPAKVKRSVLLDLNSQNQRRTFGQAFQIWHWTNVNYGQFSDQDRTKQRHALRDAFIAERLFLREQYDSQPALEPMIAQLYNEVLLAESVALDPDSEIN